MFGQVQESKSLVLYLKSDIVVNITGLIGLLTWRDKVLFRATLLDVFDTIEKPVFP